MGTQLPRRISQVQENNVTVLNAIELYTCKMVMVVDIWLYSEKRNCKSLSRIRPFATPWTIPPAPGLLCPWHSPGRNTGVGCHFLLQRIFCCCSVTKLCLTLCYSMDRGSPGYPVLHYLLEFASALMSIELVMPSNRLILCRPLLLLPSIFPSIRVFSSESAFCFRWPRC